VDEDQKFLLLHYSITDEAVYIQERWRNNGSNICAKTIDVKAVT